MADLDSRQSETAGEEDVALLLASLPSLPEPVARPVLVALVGLPGAGKSSFSRCLAQEFPLLVLESDSLRRALFPQPSYGPEESARLFQAIHRVIARLLQVNTPVLLDATNLSEGHREPLYRLAERAGAKLILVRVEAPEPVVQQRLAHRRKAPDPADLSEANWAVYQKMRGAVEPIRRKHYAVDTSQDINPAVRRVVRELQLWLRTS
jgi:hypothetical protein